MFLPKLSSSSGSCAYPEGIKKAPTTKRHRVAANLAEMTSFKAVFMLMALKAIVGLTPAKNGGFQASASSRRLEPPNLQDRRLGYHMPFLHQTQGQFPNLQVREPRGGWAEFSLP